MAGSALAGTPLAGLATRFAPEGYKASAALGALKAGQGARGAAQAATQAGLANPMTQQLLGGEALRKGLKGAAILGGSLAVPGLAGGVANLLSAPARAATGGLAQVGQTGLGAVTSNQRYASKFGADLPSGVPLMMDKYGNIEPISPTDVLGALGMTRTLESQREGKAVAENLQRFGDIDLKYKEAAAKKDFERQAAMKAIGQNIATNAAMLQNAQIGAMNLGQTFGQGITDTIGKIYQYS